MFTLKTNEGKELQVLFDHTKISEDDEVAPSRWKAITYCYIVNGSGMLCSGKACCKVGDNFCRRTGREIALTRAVSKLERPLRTQIWRQYWETTHQTQRVHA